MVLREVQNHKNSEVFFFIREVNRYLKLLKNLSLSI